MSENSKVLPVVEAKNAIVKLIKRNRAVIIVGETGSGKTTQIPQYVWDEIIRPSNNHLTVCCTQPRRVAAVSIARHVAEQRGGKVGEEVGYAVRFDDTSSPKTKIKFVTDGILLREIQADPELKHYGCILLDEAHERTLHGDVLFGLLKDIARRRESLKIVIMSATLNADQFSTFWWNAPIGVVHGRAYPVTIMHTAESQADYVEAAISTILQIHEKEEPGDILCFLTGQEEIEDAKRILQQRLKLLHHSIPDFTVLTLYSAMPYEQQLLVFDPAPSGERKVILATNIAETSITVEGIRYVVDSGVVKTKYFNAKTGMEALEEMDISKAQATQRAGRAGRVAAGKCYRLYTAQAFESLHENTIPEIKRSSLISIVLQMKSLNIKNILSFEFMDSPPAKAVIKAEETLMLLQALDREGDITPLGRRLTDFPIDPTAAIVLLAAKAFGVAREALVVIALTSIENLFFSSRESKEGADKCRATFGKSSGDHLTFYSLYQAYRKCPEKERKTWCESNSISYRQILKAEDIITQLYAILAESDDEALLEKLVPHSMRFGGVGGTLGSHDSRKRGRDPKDDTLPYDDEQHMIQERGAKKLFDHELLRRSLCYGYYLQSAFFNAKLGMYQTTVGQTVVHIHPSSVLFTLRKKPALIIFTSIVRTTKRYMKDISVVHEEWLRAATPHFLVSAE